MYKKTAFLGLFACLALIFSYVEAIVPLPIPVPGVKLGLANVLIVICLYTYGVKEAVAINFVRIILLAVLFANPYSFIYSLAGAVISMALMYPLYKSKGFSIIGVSVAGAVGHNTAQILTAMAVTRIVKLIDYLPVLIISGIITGLIIGIIGRIILPQLKKIDLERVKS